MRKIKQHTGKKGFLFRAAARLMQGKGREGKGVSTLCGNGKLRGQLFDLPPPLLQLAHHHLADPFAHLFVYPPRPARMIK